MSTTDKLEALKAEYLEAMRYDIANIDNEWAPCDDLGRMLGYNWGRFDVLLELGAMTEAEHRAALDELLAAWRAAKKARGEPLSRYA
jgi:hypothetical protein